MNIWIVKTESMRGHKSEYLFNAKNINDLKKEFIKRFTKDHYNDIYYTQNIGRISNE